jgi:hypothetical protein
MIEKIYAFGTSHTAGGGFEFNVSDRYRKNPNLYKKIFDTEDHFDFSYPNILGRMINVEVVNLAKQGFGYERVNRKLIEVVSSPKFNKDSSLVLIEISDWDRKEWYSKEIGKYFITNFGPRSIDTLSFSTDYHYENKKEAEVISKYQNTLIDFYKITHNDYQYLISKLQESFIFMISFLQRFGVKFYLTNGGLPIEPKFKQQMNYDSNIVEYKFHKNVLNFVQDMSEFNIDKESRGIVSDNHQGVSVNLTIAEHIFNKMIDDKYLLSDKIIIDFNKNWELIQNKLFDD